MEPEFHIILPALGLPLKTACGRVDEPETKYAGLHPVAYHGASSDGWDARLVTVPDDAPLAAVYVCPDCLKALGNRRAMEGE